MIREHPLDELNTWKFAEIHLRSHCSCGKHCPGLLIESGVLNILSFLRSFRIIFLCLFYQSLKEVCQNYLKLLWICLWLSLVLPAFPLRTLRFSYYIHADLSVLLPGKLTILSLWNIPLVVLAWLIIHWAKQLSFG